MDIAQLNARFGIPGSLQVVAGPGGLPQLLIDTPHASARVSLHGGQVLGYRPVAQDHDLLFLSDNARYGTGKAIRGGIPVCWPWFGAHPQDAALPAHGLARTRPWALRATAQDDAGTRVSLGLVDDADSQGLWPYGFDLQLDIKVGKRLSLALTTLNTGDQAFTLSQALHSYFTVGDIEAARVDGLDACRYLDKVGGGEALQAGPVRVAAELDRVYLDTPPELVIDDPALARRIHLRAEGSRSTVVWNPWIDKSAGMADLGAADYRHFLCVETANAGNDGRTLAPGERHRLGLVCRIDPA